MACEKELFRAIKSEAELEKYKSRLQSISKRLNEFVETIGNEQLPTYTGWFVLLAKDGASESGYRFLSIFNPDISTEESEPEWDIAIPIQDINSIPEFMGW